MTVERVRVNLNVQARVDKYVFSQTLLPSRNRVFSFNFFSASGDFNGEISPTKKVYYSSCDCRIYLEYNSEIFSSGKAIPTVYNLNC